VKKSGAGNHQRAHPLPRQHEGQPARVLQGSAGQIASIISVLVLGVGALDYALGQDITLSIIYLLPIALATRSFSKKAGMLVSVVCVGIWLTGDLADSHPYSHPLIPYWNALVRLGVFFIVVHLLSNLLHLKSQLEETVTQRTSELRREIDEHKELEHAVLDLLSEQRRTIAYELHDGLAQFLTGIAFKAKLLHEDSLEKAPALAEPVAAIEQLLNRAVGQTRDIARGLDPVEVEANELIAAFRKLAAETENTFRIACTFKSDAPRLSIEPSAGGHLYRIAQQAIDNAIRHGKAKRISLALESSGNNIRIVVKDDGSGFSNLSKSHPGLGMRIMRFRADLLGGTVHFSSEPGQGACVECTIPASATGPKKERLVS
jgi:signal transduction histidine kinase